MAKEINKEIPKTMFCGQVDKINLETRTITACISSEEVDRHREIVTSAAVAKAIKAFAANPVACACHLRRSDNGTPTVVGSWNTDSFKQVGKKSYMDITFAVTELAEQYWQLYRDKHMRAFSISFMPIEFHEEKTTKGGYTVIYDEIELTEISPVTIGANRSALAKQFGFDADDESIKSIDEKIKQLDGKLSEMIDKLELLIDTTSDRCDFGDQLLNYGARQQSPDKSNAEDEIDAESAQRLADKIKQIARKG